MDESRNQYGIKQDVLEQIIHYAKTYGLARLVLFGSRARGNYYMTSDIDLAVSGGDFVRFSLDVDEDTSTLLKYDFVNLDEPIQQELMDSIEREGIVLYEKI